MRGISCFFITVVNTAPMMTLRMLLMRIGRKESAPEDSRSNLRAVEMYVGIQVEKTESIQLTAMRII